MILQNKLVIVPFGQVDKTILGKLASPLEKAFSLKVEVLPIQGLPEGAYHSRRKQHLSTMFLEVLRSFNREGWDRALGVTEVDLYVPGLNFVFGEADIQGRVSIISLFRLRPERSGYPGDEGLFYQRALKEAVHELGHTYGLGHCTSPLCVMFFSNSLADTDLKGTEFCPGCQKALK